MWLFALIVNKKSHNCYQIEIEFIFYTALSVFLVFFFYTINTFLLKYVWKINL